MNNLPDEIKLSGCTTAEQASKIGEHVNRQIIQACVLLELGRYKAVVYIQRKNAYAEITPPDGFATMAELEVWAADAGVRFGL